MSVREALAATEGRLDEIFALLVPGSSAGIVRLRREAVALCRDHSARGALLLGPAGSGKSTLARAIALGRYMYVLTPSEASKVLESIRIESLNRVSTKSMDWYVEMSLTGLVVPLADAQLFGIAGGVATGVEKRAGVFENAHTGRSPRSRSVGAQLTGGVVFLDEIGDLPPTLQPKLLTVLTGAEVPRVGGEGSADDSFSFGGLTLAATWKDVREHLRPDLLARLSDHVVTIPQLTDRREDIPHLCDAIMTEIARERHEWIVDREKLKGQGFALERMMAELERLESHRLSGGDRTLVESAPWARYGDLRGLTQVLRRVMTRGVSVEEALREQQEIGVGAVTKRSLASAVLDRLMASPPEGKAIAGAVSAVEREIRDELVHLLRSAPELLARLADHLEMDRTELRSRLADLNRHRTSK